MGKHRVPRLLLPSILDAQFGTPYPRSAGFDTDIGAFIESSTMSLPRGLMARLVVKDNIVSGGALAPGKTLRLGGFVMTAGSALKPTMTSQVIENRLRVDPEYSARMDPGVIVVERTPGSHGRLGGRHRLRSGWA